MKRTLILFLGLLFMTLSSCSLVPSNAGTGISYYHHTITAGDREFDPVANNYKITISYSKFTGIYWSELWIVRNDDTGTMQIATPNVDNNGTWYMRIANLQGAVQFRSGISMVGREIYIFYSPATSG